MHATNRTTSCLLAVCLAGSACAKEPETAALVAMIGATDTVAVESYTRTADALTGVNAVAYPRAGVRAYQVDFVQAAGRRLGRPDRSRRGGPASTLKPPNPCQESMSRASSSSSSPWVRKHRYSGSTTRQVRGLRHLQLVAPASHDPRRLLASERELIARPAGTAASPHQKRAAFHHDPIPRGDSGGLRDWSAGPMTVAGALAPVRLNAESLTRHRFPDVRPSSATSTG